MTDTELAIVKLYYRLVYQFGLKTLADVPAQYRAALEEYRREVEGA